jgi:hypothetical protein
MTIQELQRGPGNSTPPTGAWRIISAKTDGLMPGFVIEDIRKNRYVVKFDPPQYPELCSGPDVIGSKIFYALGYNTPENYVVHFRREDLQIGAGVMYRPSSGKKHPLTAKVLDELLKDQPRGPDGTYRAMASKWIPGQAVGPFSYEGMRSDDPNDIVPHQDRRELRGLRVFAAWLNHEDTRSVNSMDTLESENAVQYIKHYLIDFGSILGSAGVGPKLAWHGHEYVIERKAPVVQAVTLGLYPPRWARSEYRNYPGVGMLDYKSFDPVSWKASYPNPAFELTDREDAFWAAKQVAAFSDDEIRALVKTGEYTDSRTADWIAECLIKRRGSSRWTNSALMMGNSDSTISPRAAWAAWRACIGSSGRSLTRRDISRCFRMLWGKRFRPSTAMNTWRQPLAAVQGSERPVRTRSRCTYDVASRKSRWSESTARQWRPRRRS